MQKNYEENGMQAIDNAEFEETLSLVIELPREYFTDTALENLKRLIKSKGSLIKKALMVTDLPLEISDETVRFPWFANGLDAESVKAYTQLISALSEMAKTNQRVSTVEKSVENEKYAFRCFLLRLGFIGEEYKCSRKVLLKNLEGNSSFKSLEARE